jgi:glycosyltransferase involved in cell wall biosynthesis
MKTISLVMIVRNEEQTLPACLDSVAGLVDQYVVVDTGSTDGTREIIKQRCGKLHEIPFVNFVETKNKALELATGDYVLFMDADERLIEGHDVIRAAVESDTVCIAGLIVEGPLPNIIQSYYRARVWRNDGQWTFSGPGVHEVICGPANMTLFPGIRVHHDHTHRTAGSYTARWELYIGLLRAALERNPRDTRAAFYLARTLSDNEQTLAAIQAYQYYLSLSSEFRDENWQAAYDIAACWKRLGEYTFTFEALNLALGFDDRRAETYCLHGDTLMQLNRWEDAIPAYEKALSLQVPEDVTLFVNPRAYCTYPAEQLVLCYDRIKHYDDATRAAQIVIDNTVRPDGRQMNNLIWSRSMRDKRWLFALGPTPEPVTGDLIQRQGVGGLETTYIELPKTLAAMGQHVIVASRCDQAHASDGVQFVPYTEDLSWYQPEIVVSSRWFDALGYSSGKKVLWLQDAWFTAPPDSLWEQLDRVVVSSPWHRDYVAERTGSVVSAKTQVIPLGIHKRQLLVYQMPRTAYHVIYSSNPDRGLFTLIDAWPEILKNVPEATLTITYGWEGLQTWSGDESWQRQQAANRKYVTDWLETTPSAQMTGRLRKSELYLEMLRSELCAYPNNFWETFCLTALETQAAGVPMVTTAMGALRTTLNQDCNILIQGDPLSVTYRDTFTEQVSALLLDRVRLATYATECRAYVAKAPLDWTDVAYEWLKLAWQ